MFTQKLWTILFFILISGCATTVQQEGLETNQASQLDKPYVLLISIDGYRHDYTEKHQPHHLLKFIEKGVEAKGLIPTFPTLTFPNHYSIVTGLYPENHGIVANHFTAPDLDNRVYSMRDADSVVDKSFYQGNPLWNLVKKNGMVSATYFWPGSEADINGVRPSFYEKYEHERPHSDRIRTVVDWFKLPAENRPHFATLYFSTVDSAGHAFGPDSKKVGDALKEVDLGIGRLLYELEQLNLPINIFIVSDHGMAALDFSRVEYIDTPFKSKEEKELFSRFENSGSGPLVFYYYKGEKQNRNADVKKMQTLLNKGKQYKTYIRGQLPKHLNFQNNPRMGELISVATPGWTIGESRKTRVIAGMHGFDPTATRDMDGIFMAKGPQIKEGLKIERFENVHIYPLIAKILGLKINEKIDGNLKVLQPILK